MDPRADDRVQPTAAYLRWLTLTAMAYAVCHHLGSLPDGLGPAGGGTRIVDWVDLFTPAAVLVPAALTLRAAEASPRVWAWFGFGSLVYTLGKGIHLSANSIGNVVPGDTVHLWDEVVGHLLWYAGVAVVASTLIASLRGRPRPPARWAPVPALAVGVTWGTNAIGGGTAPMALAAAGVAVVLGWRWRRELAWLLLPVGVAALVTLAVGLAVGP